MPALTTTASATAWASSRLCVQTSIRRRSVRSAMTPAHSASGTTGANWVNVSRPSMNGEPVSRCMSQPWPTDCIQVPTSETPWPMKNSRNSRCRRARRPSGMREVGDAGVGIPANVSRAERQPPVFRPGRGPLAVGLERGSVERTLACTLRPLPARAAPGRTPWPLAVPKGGRYRVPDAPAERLEFLAGFLWGAATSAHQVEGGNTSNDWWRFEHRPGAVLGGRCSGDACRHLEFFDQDFALAQADGHTAHRFSLEWSRLELSPGRFDPGAVAHYHHVLASLRGRGITPIVTLHHFTNPLWIADAGGWEAPRVVDWFERFVRFCAREFGGEVDWWCTVNEPEVFAFRGWSEGVWPLAVRDNSRALTVIAHQLEAHGRAYRVLKQEDRADADGDGVAARVGFAKHRPQLEPLRPWHPLDKLQAYFEDRVFNEAV